MGRTAPLSKHLEALETVAVGVRKLGDDVGQPGMGMAGEAIIRNGIGVMLGMAKALQEASVGNTLPATKICVELRILEMRID